MDIVRGVSVEDGMMHNFASREYECAEASRADRGDPDIASKETLVGS